ncbi:MAG: hypothetical protein ACK5QC_01905 [Bacteroidota bacterium]|jgi:hypothetical protein|nr:hypothetical protein [Bacteroidota bacterium]MCA6443749.1 hypothetical protein [Bacteroidota bacterium]
MKKLIYLVLITIAVKTSAKAQNTNSHPTIDSVKVKYSSASNADIGSLTGIPTATITLKNAINASKIYLKIVDKTNNNIVYQINYNLTSPTIINNQQKLLFEKSNNKVYISNGLPLPLKPYAFEIKTEDSQNIQTQIFSIIQ